MGAIQIVVKSLQNVVGAIDNGWGYPNYYRDSPIYIQVRSESVKCYHIYKDTNTEASLQLSVLIWRDCNYS